MSTVTLDLIKKLREQTSAGVLDCRVALEEAGDDFGKASEILKKKGFDKAAKKHGREVSEGVIVSYAHHTGRVGAMVELGSETDFVGRNEEFRSLAYEIAMQVASMNPENVDALMEQSYIRDQKMTVGDLLKTSIAKFGENIVVKRFVRYSLDA